MSRVTNSAAAATGSFNCGRMAPCPPVPCTEKRSSSLEAMYFPARNPSVPTSSCGSTCSPTTARTSYPSNGFSASTSDAPPGLHSSPGWNSPKSVPRKSGSAASCCNTPKSTAACMSWPQACMTPGVHDRQPMSFCSVIGRASMSARSTTARRLGSAFPRPSIQASTPVRAIGRCSMPSSVSRSAMKAAVSCSLNDSSGCACRWRRNSVGFIRVV